jgi:hypothetical protein
MAAYSLDLRERIGEAVERFCQVSCQLAKLAGGDRIRFRRGGKRWNALTASRLR